MTVPEPVPAIITVTAYVIGGGGGGEGGMRVNVAVQVNVFAGIENDWAQGAGPQPANVELAAGAAPSATAAPAA